MAYTYIWGRPESVEPYLMMTYILWFTAIRQKCSVSALRLVSQELQGIEASYLAYTYICGRPTESGEPYLILTYMYISWFTAFRKNVQFLRLGQVLSKYKGYRLHTWLTLTFGEDQQKLVNRI